jgi:hypothetical protein
MIASLRKHRTYARFTYPVSSRAPFPGILPLPWRKGEPIHRTRRMTRSRSTWYLSFSPAGAVATLLAFALLAPPAAKASCSHLVTSENGRGHLTSLVEPLMLDLAGPSDPHSVPRGPRPCSGAWCSGQPATPPVPSGLFDGPLGSWALFVSIPDEVSTAPSFLSAETSTFRPLLGGNDVFHPPRLFPPL